MIYKQEYYENIAENIIGKFNTRGIEGYYCTDREEANAKAKRFLTPGCTISWGGSETLLEIGLIDDLMESAPLMYCYGRNYSYNGYLSVSPFTIADAFSLLPSGSFTINAIASAT